MVSTAVYDRTGWHPMPYLNQGEFYSEFGSLIRITLPRNYVVAATGELQNEELQWHSKEPKTEIQKNNACTEYQYTCTTRKNRQQQIKPAGNKLP